MDEMALPDTLTRCRAAYHQLVTETGRPPKSDQVAKAAGVAKNAVRLAWDEITGVPGVDFIESRDVPALRKCLCCSRNFPSSHIGNRLCEPCKGTTLF